MPNPSRIAYPGALYHIWIRGNGRGDIFSDDIDRRFYLHLLCACIIRFSLEIYAYVLMSNHIHLFLKTLLPNISEVMLTINRNYSHYFNKRHMKTGHLFESRYKNKVVQHDKYFLGLLRYIHQNPVKAGIVADPAQYKWSSHRAYLGNTAGLIVKVEDGLKLFSDDPVRARACYAAFVGQSIPDNEWEILDKNRNGILGDAAFRRSLRAYLKR
jgi:putative transposase